MYVYISHLRYINGSYCKQQSINPHRVRYIFRKLMNIFPYSVVCWAQSHTPKPVLFNPNWTQASANNKLINTYTHLYIYIYIYIYQEAFGNSSVTCQAMMRGIKRFYASGVRCVASASAAVVLTMTMKDRFPIVAHSLEEWFELTVSSKTKKTRVRFFVQSLFCICLLI